MAKDNLDYYVIPSEDAHQSEYVAVADKRREWISGFTGSAGQAIVSKTAAYLVTDSRYWIQAEDELDPNWHLIAAGAVDGPKDWIDWLIDRVRDSRIGIDARMLSHEKAATFNAQLTAKSSKLIYPPQNFVDLIWKDKPMRSREPIFVQPMEFTGKDASSKLSELRSWVRKYPPATLSYSKAAPTPAQMHVATLVTSLSSIAWLLNLRGADIPYNPLFQAYFFLSLERSILFTDPSKMTDNVREYLDKLGIERREYNDVWSFLRRREWGEGKVLISPQTSYAISLMLTHFRYTIAPSIIDDKKAVKNDTEIEGMRRAYLRDGASFVRWFAWLDMKISQGFDVTEYEAAWRLTEFRKQNKHYWGLAYENISASGPNAALPHYSPTKAGARMIDRDTPYLNDSGGQYRDGTCDTTRTIHFGRPTQDQCEAYTRVLQGHIAIDSAVFPEGTTGAQLDVLARKALWKDGLNYMHGTGHGFGSFLNVHEGPHSFSSPIPLVPGHVITNEPGFYLQGKWGMRIESALAVKRIRTKGEFNGDIWLGFERLTCVPIQTRMVKEGMLSKDEKQWLKEHNQRCRDLLEPYLKDDKRALKWLRRESERGIGLAPSGPGGIYINWD
jgi:Xaa-Pro aminopeptidase